MTTPAAALLFPISVSGSRLADGTVNGAGKVWLYEPDTTDAITAYEDKLALYPYPAGAITLGADGKADIYVTESCDVVVEDAAGAALDTIYCPLDTLAGLVTVANAGYTGTLASGAQGAGGKTSLDTVLGNIAASLGGSDGNYLESTGATAVAVSDWIGRLGVSVRDFGAKGDGATDDTTACQAAIARVIARGGGVVYFPKGTYYTSQTLSISPSSTSISVTLKGAAGYASAIKCNSATLTLVNFIKSDRPTLEDLRLDNAQPSSGAAIRIGGCLGATFNRVYCVDEFRQALDVQEYGAYPPGDVTAYASHFYAYGASGVGVRIGQASTLASENYRFFGCDMSGTAAGIAIGGTARDLSVIGCRATGVYVGDGAAVSGCTGDGGKGVSVIGSRVTGSTPFVIGATGALQFQEYGNTLNDSPSKSDLSDGSVYGSAGWVLPLGFTRTEVITKTAPNTITPNLALGNVKVLQVNGLDVITMATPTAGALTIPTGAQLRFIIQVGAAGITSWSWGGAYLGTYKSAYTGHGALALGSACVAANATGVYDFVYDGATWVFVGSSK